MIDLTLLAARYRLDLENAESLIRAADALLKENRATPATVQLYLLEAPEMPKAGALFERACAELGMPVPTHDAAIVQLIRHYAEAIASGMLEPWKGLLALMSQVYDRHVSKEPTKNYVGDSRGLEQLIGDYYYFDDLIEDWELRKNQSAFAKKVSEWEESVRQHAREWLERHPGS